MRLPKEQVQSTKDEKCILISDNAGGIEKSIIPTIFERKSSTSSNKDNMGIGLYLAKNIIVEKMEGKIEATNIKNGALFTITFPLLKK